MLQGRVSTRRRVVSWVVSLVIGAGLLWLASTRLDLWPDTLHLPHPGFLWAAVAAQLPYAYFRAARLGYLLDPIVAASSDSSGPDAVPRFDRRVLHGSGLVSFFVILALPLRLGELSRPLLLASGRQPGVRVTEGITAAATERVVDGLMVCALLFLGLWLSPLREGSSIEDLAYARVFGRWMTGVFVVGLVVLVIAARDPDRARAVAMRLGAALGPLRERVADIVHRFAGAVRGLGRFDRAAGFLGQSAIYWGITVLQLWLVLRACGISLGLGEAAAIVAIVGLSIQLPGGPLQAGTFQVGMSVALRIFPVDADAGSTFAALMYLLQVAGAAALAVVGAVLLARASAGSAARAPEDPAPP